MEGRPPARARLAVSIAIGLGRRQRTPVPGANPHRPSLPLAAAPRRHFISEHVRTVVRNFFPVFLSRGVVQISAYIDSLLASFLPTGAVSALAYAQTLYTLPVSLFGMAISAAELPAMSSPLGTDDEIAARLRAASTAALQQIAFFVIPSAVGFLVLGDVVVAAIYRSGHFSRPTPSSSGASSPAPRSALASTSGRLYSSAFYALRNTRTPLNFALIRVALTLRWDTSARFPCPASCTSIRAGAPPASRSPPASPAGSSSPCCGAGCTHASATSPSRPPASPGLWLAALLAAAACFALKLRAALPPAPAGGRCVLIPYAALYVALTSWMGVEAAGGLLRRLRRRPG